MELRKVGKSGVVGTAIALGTWAIGGGGFWDKEDDDIEAIETIRAAVEGGITMIDTAPGYGEGKSERLIREALKDVPRDKYTISTKCGLVWFGDEGGYMHTLNGKRYYRNLTPKSMRIEVENSLERLGVDCIDVYFTHWPSLPSFPTPIAETMQGLVDMKKEGLIKAIGASNVDLNQIKEYMDVAHLDAIQPPYSMLTRGVEAETLSYCVENEISVFAYSPLEQGLLTGNIGMDYEPPAGTYRADYLGWWYKKENRIKILNMLEGWKDLTEKYDCTVSQLVIAWTIAQKGITFALCGARKRKHLLENIKAGNLKIEQADLDRMRKDVEALPQPE